MNKTAAALAFAFASALSSAAGATTFTTPKQSAPQTSQASQSAQTPSPDAQIQAVYASCLDSAKTRYSNAVYSLDSKIRLSAITRDAMLRKTEQLLAESFSYEDRRRSIENQTSAELSRAKLQIDLDAAARNPDAAAGASAAAALMSAGREQEMRSAANLQEAKLKAEYAYNQQKRAIEEESQLQSRIADRENEFTRWTLSNRLEEDQKNCQLAADASRKTLAAQKAQAK